MSEAAAVTGAPQRDDPPWVAGFVWSSIFWLLLLVFILLPSVPLPATVDYSGSPNVSVSCFSVVTQGFASPRDADGFDYPSGSSPDEAGSESLSTSCDARRTLAVAGMTVVGLPMAAMIAIWVTGRRARRLQTSKSSATGQPTDVA